MAARFDDWGVRISGIALGRTATNRVLTIGRTAMNRVARCVIPGWFAKFECVFRRTGSHTHRRPMVVEDSVEDFRGAMDIDTGGDVRPFRLTSASSEPHEPSARMMRSHRAASSSRRVVNGNAASYRATHGNAAWTLIERFSTASRIGGDGSV